MTNEASDPEQDGGRAEASAKAYEDVARAAQDGVAEAGDAPEVADPADEVDPALLQAQEEAASFRDLALRAQAEADNIRRRAARDLEQARKFALEKFAGELLPVLDSIEKAVEAAGALAEGEDTKAMAEGVTLCHRLFIDTFGKAGITLIDPHGEPFDPEQHQAMAMIDAPNAAPSSVVDVLQKGYALNGRLLRAAMVVVAKGA
ncbi:MAG: nucleotide exchange factor GrpE [Pseudomonadales bacterium]|nr:nucleotide exchange factor GrpE [Pseudomonadales bacterium]